MAVKIDLLRASMLVLLGTVILITLLFTAFGMVIGNSTNQRIGAAMAQSTGVHRAKSLAALLSAQVEQIHGLATNPQLVALTSGNELIESAAELPPLIDSFTAGVNIRLLSMTPLGIADNEFDSSRFGSNIVIDMISRAFRDERPSPEIYQSEGRWLIGLAAPVRAAATSSIRGVLLVNIDAVSFFRQALGDDAGEFQLFSGGREVYRGGSGSEGFRSDRLSVPGMPLSMAYSPTAEQLQDYGLAAAPWLAVLLLAAAAMAAAIVVVMLHLQRVLRSEVKLLDDLASKQRGATAAAPPLKLQALAPLAQSIQELLKRSANTKGRDNGNAAAAEASAAPAKSSSEALAAMLEDNDLDEGLDDSLELELDEELQIPAELFRAYDIRGDAQLLSDVLVLQLGRALGSIVLERSENAFVVGADARDSSPRIREALVKGLIESGCDVIDIGTVATPMLYFAAQHLQTHNAVMVTGSHHGSGVNGLKLLIGGQPFCGEDIQALRTRIEAGDFAEGQGSYRVSDINGDYINAMTEDIVISDKPRIVVDCGNGAAAVIATELFEALGAEVLPMFAELDGRFPNHPPDPSDPQNLQQLAEAVKAQEAVIGIAFDGDGDRIGVVDGSGTVIGADTLMMLFARDVLSRHPGADIVFDVKCSRHLARVISEAGGRPIMWRSGHAWIKTKMHETGALLGGEFTGHICFRERWFGFDDALYCGARLLEIISLDGRSLSDLVAEFPGAVATPEILIPVEESEKQALINKVLQTAKFDGAKVITLDGLRAEFDDGWGLVRASNTGAALTLRFEADTEEALARIRALFRQQLEPVLGADKVTL